MISLLALLPAVFAQMATTAPANGTAPVGLPQQQQVAYSIPFTTIPGQGTPLVHVLINGHTDATFTVDTGSDNCAVSEDLATKLGALPHPAVLGTQPLMLNGKQAQAIDLTSLQIGGVSVENPLLIQPLTMPIIVLSGDQLRKIAASPIDGVIGADLLAHFAVDLDFQHRVMTFYYPGALSMVQVHYAGFDAPADVPVRMTLSDTHYQYSVPVQIANGDASRQVDLMLDTGSKVTILSQYLAETLSLTSTQSQQVVGLSRSFDADVAQASSLRVGGIQVRDFPVAYPHTGEFLTVLGLDFLSGYDVLMDFPAKRMYIRPPVTIALPIRIGPASPATPPTTTPKQTGGG